MEEAFALNARVGLEGDGVACRLFEILWRRDLLSDSSLALRIPDTVIFKYNAPSLWYFTSVDGTIKRKTKGKVNCEHIEREFLKRPSPSGIVAYYVTTHSTAEEAVGHEVIGDEDAKNDAPGTQTTMEYFDQDGLRNFLFGRQRARSDGILQRFVEPTGDYNSMVRALWSPKVCILERRVNRVRLNDTRYDMYERAVTFEGPDFHSDITPVRGSTLMQRVHSVANSVVDHVASVTNDRVRVSRLALNFKVDSKERLHLLFASSVRLRDEMKRSTQLGHRTSAAEFAKKGFLNTPLELDAPLAVPDHIRKIGTTATRHPVKIQKTWCCTTCEEKVEAGSLFDISYKVLIEYAEQRAGANQVLPAPDCPPKPSVWSAGDTEANLEIPAALKHLHPRLSLTEYRMLRHDVAFLHKAAAVCEACYLKYSLPQLGPAHGPESGPVCCSGESAVSAIEQDLIGTQNLNPEALRRRQCATLRRIKDNSAAEEDFEQELWQQRRRCEKECLKERAKSCPKLPSWGPSHTGAVLWPPAPVLSRCHSVASAPPVPTEAPPRGTVAAVVASAAAAREAPTRHMSDAYFSREGMPPPKRVPPLRGAPYLKGLQEFAAHHSTRAEYVLPHAFSQFLGAGSVKRSQNHQQKQYQSTSSASAIAAHPLGSQTPKAAESSDVQEVTPAEDLHTDPQTRDDRDPAPSGLESDPELETGVGSDSDDLLNVSEAERATLAGLWKSMWPSNSGKGSGTPTTRPPSQGDTAQVSSAGGSQPSTRPSTRTSSRPHSAMAAVSSACADFQNHRRRRPSSSPQVQRQERTQDTLDHTLRAEAAADPHRLLSPSAGHRLISADALAGRRLVRPRSSPQLAGGRPLAPIPSEHTTYYGHKIA